MSVDASVFMLGVLYVICNERKEKNYISAYNFVDILHIFPQIVKSNQRKQIMNYCEVYVEPILVAAKEKEYEVCKFKKCRI